MSNIILFQAATLLLAILFAASHVAFSVELDENDYIIKNFGIEDNNPFIIVQGIAGGSYDESLGDEGYNAYVFDTNMGVYQVRVFYTSSGDPGYSTSRILSNISEVGDCLLTEPANGIPNFSNQTLRYVDSAVEFSDVKKVLAIQVSLDDPDEECTTGEHVRKIISVASKPLAPTIQN